MLGCDNPPPVTVILDPGDDLVHTRAALAVHAPEAGRLTVHPTPGTDSVLTLAYDVLAALDKPVPAPGYRQLDTAPAWTLAAAWILATSTSHLMLLRAHFLTPHRPAAATSPHRLPAGPGLPHTPRSRARRASPGRR
ncbi:hypothetical protein ACFYZJ_38630 [Streptomyces sp. NPDC001848]|uniref:hypothetical protein n=1 Tax=Streptomyces sp. NPDC001848 TaxID=3364618 RepID=UPI003680F089